MGGQRQHQASGTKEDPDLPLRISRREKLDKHVGRCRVGTRFESSGTGTGPLQGSKPPSVGVNFQHVDRTRDEGKESPTNFERAGTPWDAIIPDGGENQSCSGCSSRQS